MIFQNPAASFEIATAIPMFILWIIMMGLTTYLIINEKLSTKLQWAFYLATLIIGGLILGAIPSAVMPIQQILAVIGLGLPFLVIIPMIIILALLLVSTLFIGRMFCGYACPVGAMQELASKVNFKNDVKKQKKVKYKVDVPQKYTNLIRWGFFGLLIVAALVWNMALLQLINPFLGINSFRNPGVVVAVIPIITLIAILALSFFLYRPWCRILCPFGALTGITARFSRYKYVRTEKCTDCGLCEQICPTNEAGSDSKKGECYFCQRCIDVCPQDAIILKK